MRRSGFVVAAALSMFIGCQEPIDPTEILPDGPVTNPDGDLNALKAIGQYNGESRCTAVFVKLSDNASAPAYVLTNGHCVQNWDANRVYVAQPETGHSVTFNVFQGVPAAERITIPTRQLAYSTMKGTDLAVVELQATVQELTGRGISPLPIASVLPEPGTAIQVYGVPVQDVPQEEWVLRRSSGRQGNRVAQVLEFIWTWFELMANDAPGMVGGYSGSPVLTNARDGVFALINTTTLGGTSPCYLGAPCEATAQGSVQFREKTNYALSVLDVPGCVTSSGTFDLNQPGCRLDKGNNAQVTGYPLGAFNPTIALPNGRPQPTTWNTRVSGFAFYRYKLGPAGSVNPRDPNGYSPVRPASTLISDPLPTADGQYLLAVVGGNSPVFDATWQQPAQATVVRVQVDLVAPTAEPRLNVVELDNALRVELLFSPPELSAYYYKIGPPETTIATDPTGYRPYLRVPITINRRDLPQKLCVYGTDQAGNRTTIVERIFR